MIRDFNSAIAKLAELTAGGRIATEAELRQLVNEVSVEATGSVTVLFGGALADGKSASAAVSAMQANNEDVRIIKNTAAAKFLEDPRFSLALVNTFDLDDVGQLQEPRGTRANLFLEGTSGLWGDVSENFLRATTGEVRILMGEGVNPDRILLTREIPILLEKIQSGSDVTEVSGISLEKLIEIGGGDAGNLDMASIRNAFLTRAYQETLYSGASSANYRNYLTLTDENLAQWMAHPTDGASAQMAQFVEKYPMAASASRLFARMGPGFAVLGAVFVGFQANEAHAAGRPEEALRLIEDYSAQTVGSEVAGAAAGGIAAMGLGLAALAGAAVSAPVSAALVLVATVVGGFFGGDWGMRLVNLFRDNAAAQAQDTAERILKAIYGDDVSLDMADPQQQVVGASLFLDQTYSRANLGTSTSQAEMLDGAMGSIAWRYALRELNPFVISGLSYDQHNTDGSLNLYDPATGQGAMSEEYLADRAAMLTWKLRYDAGMGDDNDLIPANGQKPYTEDWDTSTVQGNWDFVDLGTTLPGGDPLTLQIDGQGITLHDHQVVFGSNANETIEGAGDTDRLYGGGGNDTIKGLDGADHLEGNAGDDTLEGGEGNDTLVGGTGNDRYEFSGDFGFDTVVDADGSGVLQIDGQAIGQASAIERVSENVWESADGRWVFTINSMGLVVGRRSTAGAATVDATVLVRNWQEGQLGIELGTAQEPGTTEQPVAGVFRLHGNQVLDAEHRIHADQVLADGTWVHGIAVPGRDDYYEAGWISDGNGGWVDRSRVEYDGLDGNDAVVGYRYDDRLRGGDGDDVLFGGAGSDVIHGGSGNDVILGAQSASMTMDHYLSFQALGVVASGWIASQDPDNPWRIDRDRNGHLVSGHFLFDYERQEGGAYALVPENPNDADTLVGGAGDDHIWGGAGQDLIDGGDDDDQLQGLGGHDQLLGGDGDDVMFGDANPLAIRMLRPDDHTYDAQLIVHPQHIVDAQNHGDDFLDGGAGDDLIYGDGGDDVLLGGEGNDQLVGGADADMLYGGAGNDRMFGDGEDQGVGGTEPDDHLDGGEGDDFLVGGAGRDELLGRTGDDTLVGGAGQDTLRGGDGADTLTGDGGNLNDESSDDGDLLDGGGGNDELIGEGGEDILLGGGGDDRLWGGVGADVLEGGMGTDLLFGQDGNDVLSGGGGADVLFGGLGNDVLHLDGQDFADGGQGDDVYHIASVSVGASGEVPVSLISDSQGQNQLVVDGAAPVNLADVQVFSQDGHVFAALGSSALVGLADGATLTQLSVRTNDQGGAEQLTGLQAVVERDDDAARVRSGIWVNGAVVHTSTLDTAQTVVGSSTNDLVEGGSGSDVLRGQAGDDALVGGEGNDTLYADGGNNVLEGGRGNDELNVGSSDDLTLMTDTVVYRLGDGLDHIQVSAGAEAGSRNLVLEFGEGLSLANLDLDSFNGSENGEHWLTFGPGQGLVLTAGTAELIQELRFADGTSMSRSEWVGWLQSQSFSGSTTVGNEYADSTLVGTANNDHLLGGGGNDVLSGGLGNDLLEGAAGHNRYVFHADSGRDQILIHDGEAAELLLTQANLAQLTVLQDASGITVRIDDTNSVQLTSVSGDVQALLQVVISDGQGASQSLGAILGAPPPTEPLSLQDRRDEFLDAQHHELGTLGQRFLAIYGRYRGSEFLARPNVVETSVVQLSEGDEYLHGSYLTVSSTTEELTFSRRVPVYETVTTTVGETVEVFVPVDSGVATNGDSDLLGATAVRDAQGRVIGFLVPTLSGARETTESRLIGWETSTYTELNTIAQDTVHQVQLQGTSGADVIRPNDAAAQATLDGYGNEAAYPVLFRGSIETGDGDDLIVLNSGSNGIFPGVDSSAVDWGFMNLDEYGDFVSDHYFRGRGAWIDAGSGNDTIGGTDGHDVIVGGSGSDTMDGQAGSDVYLTGFESGVVDHIVEVAHFNPYEEYTWQGYLFQTYGGDLSRQNIDTVEFDSSVQLERLTYRLIGDEPMQGWQGYEQSVTLQLFMDHVFFLEVTIPAVDAVSGVSLPGIDVFRFADGTELQTGVLLDLLSQEADLESLNLVGGEGNDVLIGASGDDTLSGVAGDDQLIGGAGNDVLDGGTGRDVLLGGEGDDQYVLRVGDDEGVTSEIQDALGSNTVLLQEGNLADMALSAQEGGWLWRYSTDDAVLLNGQFSVNVNGQAFSLQALDAAIAAAAAGSSQQPEQEEPPVAQDALVGEDGNDNLMASESHTQVWGGGGNDVLVGYWGGAELIGGAGDDSIHAAGGAHNTLHGGSGDDELTGDWGADALFGGTGNDTLEGGGGSDVLVGGVGDDLLEGGAAADTYRFGLGGWERSAH
ncbi:hypothetical protein [Hydrogenophaga sp. A37]|uniref:hypothetical protein n=1 Tax=Hydrogenophaga sp. A37 TaxID=1945864 RepID=UPI0009863CE1|nr:hypothetical protein [Hydrogenophaga sp. A37]